MSLADLYSALADPTRLRVLELLHDKARPVHELAAAFDISRPAISRHLRVLKEIGLVQEVKQGRENLYSFQRDELKPGMAWLETHQKKPGRGKKAAVGVAVAPEAPETVEAPAMVAEPIAPEPIVAAPVVAPEPVLVAPEPVPEPMVAASEPPPEPIIVVKPKAPAKPRVARPKAEAEPVAPPPPKQTPQLSFFDL
ncbi:metalloregulator ArsR/SmtB family transcription factor [Devosia sp. LjRoot16]|uniref:ArsR/SmtB family transcription factor n=1 Tax=Devosia sp. LjRoot16 TaxID=3342271 RepID=UPI003ED04AFC